MAPDTAATPWPEDLTNVQIEALGELVHDQASQIASNTVNAGVGDMRDFLLMYGWTVEQILDELPKTGENALGEHPHDFGDYSDVQ